MLKQCQFKTCFPLTGERTEAVIEEIKEAMSKPVDYIEWRRDYFKEDKLETVLKHLNNQKVIFTWRKQAEGGQQAVSDAKRLADIKTFAQGAQAGYVDIELENNPSLIKDVKTVLQESNIQLILSYHHFEKMVAKEKISMILKAMEDAGADVLKVALTCKNEQDLKMLLSAVRAYQCHSQKPMIIIGMGKYGQITRVLPEFCGGSLTYVNSKTATAPGQLTLEEIVDLRQTFYLG